MLYWDCLFGVPVIAAVVVVVVVIVVVYGQELKYEN